MKEIIDLLISFNVTTFRKYFTAWRFDISSFLGNAVKRVQGEKKQMSNGGLHASIAFYFKKEIFHCLKPFWKVFQHGMVVNIHLFNTRVRIFL